MTQLPVWPDATKDATREWSDYFDQYAPVYEQSSFTSAGLAYVGNREIADVVSILGARQPGRVLDAGAGTGRIARAVAAIGWDVTAADISTEMLRRVARDLPSATTVHAALGRPLPFADDSFDAVLAIRVLKYVPDLSVAIGELARVLRPGGIAVVEFTNRRSVARFGYGAAPAHLVTLPEAAALFADAGLRVVERRAGTYLPQPVWRAAKTARRAKIATAVERTLDGLSGGTRTAAGVRSVLLVGAPM